MTMVTFIETKHVLLDLALQEKVVPNLDDEEQEHDKNKVVGPLHCDA
jgi:hypothetical protein